MESVERPRAPLARRGAAVGLLARGEKGLAGAVEDVEAAGGRALAIPADVSDFAQVQAAAAQVEREFGPSTYGSTSASTSVFAPFSKIEPVEFVDTVTEVSYLGFVYGTRAALDVMLPRDRGAIVQVGSALAYRGIPLQSAYCGAKHAIQGFNEALRCELLHDKSNVKVTMLLPAVNTPQFSWVLNKLPRRAQPVPPIYQPSVAAEAICHAAEHPERREYWVGGSTMGTLIANAIAPGLDRYLAKTGYKSQQTQQQTAPDDPANLLGAGDGRGGHDFGPRGAFTDR